MHVGTWGHAAEDAEVMRDLYAFAAAAWVDAGNTRHTVVVPATDANLVDAWFRLCFGQQQAYAVREVTAAPVPKTPARVRVAAPVDLETIVALDPLLQEHQQLSPTFSGRDLLGESEVRAEWKETLADDSTAVFIAEVDRRAVGVLLLTRAERDYVAPEGNVDLSWAATTPDVRGSGAGLALTAAALNWAHAHEYRTMTTDWRVTNLLSSRFWPARGFRAAFLRLYRSIP
jgi:GNAT superfamily N-acetyltransferase